MDGTVGAGGHARAILEALDSKGRLIGMDRDPEVLNIAKENLKDFGERFIPYHGSYENLEEARRLSHTEAFDGILLDLGVSSLQLDHPERGFSFKQEGPLDMRMDSTETVTAAEIVQKASEKELEKIFCDYGEERFAKRIARLLIERRRSEKIQTTTELAQLISQAIPRPAWPHKIHPATRAFQGLRIAVNRELDRLQNFLEQAPDSLTPLGRLAILAYHSLEDRIVKQTFVKWHQQKLLRRITKKPIFGSEAEIHKNPRARSVRLRVIEKPEGGNS